MKYNNQDCSSGAYNVESEQSWVGRGGTVPGDKLGEGSQRSGVGGGIIGCVGVQRLVVFRIVVVGWHFHGETLRNV